VRVNTNTHDTCFNRQVDICVLEKNCIVVWWNYTEMYWNYTNVNIPFILFLHISWTALDSEWDALARANDYNTELWKELCG